jgi:hypothetical protein
MHPEVGHGHLSGGNERGSTGEKSGCDQKSRDNFD